MNFFLRYDVFNIQDPFRTVRIHLRNLMCLEIAVPPFCVHLGWPCEEDQEVLGNILPARPSAGLKRQFPNDSEDARAVSAPGKIPQERSVGRLSWSMWPKSERRLADTEYTLQNLCRQFKMNSEMNISPFRL